jgi:hypothetical protein
MGIQHTQEKHITKPEGKTPLGTHRHSWENNIKIDLKRNNV